MRKVFAGRAVRYAAEAALYRIAIPVFRLLGVDAASALGGFVGRSLGPAMKRSRIARRNLRKAFPEKDDVEIDAILRAMWDNLGRTAAEFAHLDKFDCYAPGGRIEIAGTEHVERARDAGNGAIYVAGHIANWEILPLAASQRGARVAEVYRAANNPRIDGRVVARRRAAVAPVQLPKSPGGTRGMIAHLREGGHVAMLVDQKISTGVAAPFFGRDAMTPTAPALLALKLGCPIIPARIERLAGARFRIRIFPPLQLPATGSREADVLAITTEINALFESWIRARPGQWLWLHRRWPD